MNRKIIGSLIFLSLTMIIAGRGVSAQTSRIVFLPGSASAEISGRLNKKGERRFALRARAGQKLSAIVISEGCVKFKGGVNKISYTTRRGDNYLTIVNSCARGTVFFNLRVLII